jgi:hypothetical protein
MSLSYKAQRQCKIPKHNQRDIMIFIVVRALHVSSGFSAHHQELKNCTGSIGYLSKLCIVTASLAESELTTHKFYKYPMLHVQFLNS